MDQIYFLARYIPFWAIPFLLIGGEFLYLFWVRKKKKSMMVCAVFVVIGLTANIFYYWAGGPEKSVKEIREIVRYYTT